MKRTLLVAIVCGFVPAQASIALACSASACVSGWASPASGTTIPANTPALPFLPSHQFLPQDMGPISEVELLDSSGTVVPATISSEPAHFSILTPTTPLAVGSY